MNKKLFKKAIQEIIDNDKEDYRLFGPRLFFIKAINLYKKKGGQINLNRRLFNDYIPEERLFMEILNDLKIPIKKGILAELRVVGSSVVTSAMMVGAKGRERHHQGVLKHNG